MTGITSSSGLVVVVLFVLTITFSLISASVMGALFSIPAMQTSFAKKSGSGGSGSGDSSPKKDEAKVDNSSPDKPACAGCPGKGGGGQRQATVETGSDPTNPDKHCNGASCPLPTPQGPPKGLTDTQKEDSVACDANGVCEDGQDHSHDGFRNGCFFFGTHVTCHVCRGPNDLVIKNCGPRTIVTQQTITQVPVATPGLTSVQLTNLSARIAQLQSMMSKPYGAECKSQIQTLLDVTQQALDAQNGFIADHMPTLRQGIPACYGSNVEQITERS